MVELSKLLRAFSESAEAFGPPTLALVDSPVQRWLAAHEEHAARLHRLEDDHAAAVVERREMERMAVEWTMRPIAAERRPHRLEAHLDGDGGADGRDDERAEKPKGRPPTDLTEEALAAAWWAEFDPALGRAKQPDVAARLGWGERWLQKQFSALHPHRSWRQYRPEEQFRPEFNTDDFRSPFDRVRGQRNVKESRRGDERHETRLDSAGSQ